MPDKTIHELLVELEASLRGGDAINDEDRALVRDLHADLNAAVAKPAAAPANLRPNLSAAVDSLSARHPRLSSLLSRALDALSDVGL